MKLRLFIIITLFLLAVNAAFAGGLLLDPVANTGFIGSLSRTGNTLNVTADTTSLSDGYIYFQYVQSGNADLSSATIQGFSPVSILGSRDTADEANGVNSAYDLTLGNVVFYSADAQLGLNLEDYNQAIQFGGPIAFQVQFTGENGLNFGSSSTLSMWLFQDASGGIPLMTINGDPNNDGKLFDATYTSAPEPSFLLLLCPSLLGVFGFRKHFIR